MADMDNQLPMPGLFPMVSYTKPDTFFTVMNVGSINDLKFHTTDLALYVSEDGPNNYRVDFEATGSHEVTLGYLGEEVAKFVVGEGQEVEIPEAKHAFLEEIPEPTIKHDAARSMFTVGNVLELGKLKVTAPTMHFSVFKMGDRNDYEVHYESTGMHEVNIKYDETELGQFTIVKMPENVTVLDVLREPAVAPDGQDRGHVMPCVPTVQEMPFNQNSAPWKDYKDVDDGGADTASSTVVFHPAVDSAETTATFCGVSFALCAILG
eukprot:221327_1